MTTKARKKLIEVALPLELINAASAREKEIKVGKPNNLHLWWAPRPLAAARAVIFAQMVDDPSSFPDLFPSEKKQEEERSRLFRIIEELVKWENNTNETVLQKAREEIWTSWRRACAENADHPRAKELFDRNVLPAFHDPFAGGGALPLEAQRLGLESHASDLNPVAVLINIAKIAIPASFADRAPVNPKRDMHVHWKGALGLAEDLAHYGEWIREEAEKRIGELYPKVAVTAEMVKEQPHLKPYIGQELTVVAWLWARTVKSPNPAFANIHVPLASTFMLSTKEGKEAYVEPVIEGSSYRFTVKVGSPKNAEKAKSGTKASRANFSCLMSGSPVSGDYIKAEGNAGRMGARLMAIVAEGARGRVYLAPTPEHEAAALNARPEWKPEGEIAKRMTGGNCTPYGLTTWGDLFNQRQLVALTTLSDLVGEAIQQVRRDALKAGLADDPKPLHEGGTGAMAYAEVVGVYLALALSRSADWTNSMTRWLPHLDKAQQMFSRHAIPMAWDYTEINPLTNVGGSLLASIKNINGSFNSLCFNSRPKIQNAFVSQADCATQKITSGKVVSTDPPYYDNIGYADLSDFFYIWLRRSLRNIFPNLFATLAVPKDEELVATSYRHGSKEKAETFFLDGMTQAMKQIAGQAHPAFPVTIYYAFKQSESDDQSGTTNTGWDTFLAAVIEAGFAITGTWPVRTEKNSRTIGIGTNALASSIVIVCRTRETAATSATRREFVAALKAELPIALHHLQAGNIAPVDLAQAAIGPGMAVYTRYTKVLDAEGKTVPVREALALINQVLGETLAEQEGDFDADSRWALTWFEQQGFAEGEYGMAEQLSKSKNTSVVGMVVSGIVESKRGKVRLLRPSELPPNWDPAADKQRNDWEIVHHLLRSLEAGGESSAAQLVIKLGAKAEVARELCYRLYTMCERKKRAAEAMAYNGLVQSWPEITRLAREVSVQSPAQGGLFENTEN